MAEALRAEGISGRIPSGQRVWERVGIREEEPVSEPARPEARAINDHLRIDTHKNLIIGREDGKGDAFAGRVSCRRATDQSLPKVNQTLRESRPVRA